MDQAAKPEKGKGKRVWKRTLYVYELEKCTETQAEYDYCKINCVYWAEGVVECISIL